MNQKPSVLTVYRVHINEDNDKEWSDAEFALRADADAAVMENRNSGRDSWVEEVRVTFDSLWNDFQHGRVSLLRRHEEAGKDELGQVRRPNPDGDDEPAHAAGLIVGLPDGSQKRLGATDTMKFEVLGDFFRVFIEDDLVLAVDINRHKTIRSLPSKVTAIFIGDSCYLHDDPVR